jgi:2-enoate reductase
MALTHYFEGGRGAEESIMMAQRLESIGVDALLVDHGCYESWYWPHPPVYQPAGCMVDAAETIKQAVKVPVIAVGKLGYAALAERILEQGKADFIALGRPLLADAEWPNKVRQARTADIRPCIGCHSCLNRVILGSYISCAVNPVTGNERELSLVPTTNRKSILIVGGGPGGMEAAQVAAQRGHQVKLWEKNETLGGALHAASKPEFKKDIKGYMDYAIRQIDGTDIEVVLGMEATPESITKENADVVIFATGSDFIPGRIPGAERENIFTASDLLMKKEVSGDTAVVIGGGTVGCEIAVYLAQLGKKVTVIEMTDHLANGLFAANRQQLLRMLTESAVSAIMDSEVKSIASEGILIVNKKSEETLVNGDVIVIACGRTPNNQLYGDLNNKLPQVHSIGDCVQPRLIMNAVWEAYRLARLI